MKPVEIAHPGTPDRDDPQVEVGMKVWDNLTPDEQREFFRSAYRSVLAHQRTSDIDHLVGFAESVDSMVRLESTTDLRERIRARHNVEPVPADPDDVAELIRQLER